MFSLLLTVAGACLLHSSLHTVCNCRIDCQCSVSHCCGSLILTLPQNKIQQEIWANAHKTRESLWQFRFSNLAKNWGVHAKLMYKYQILYLDRITLVPWRHLVNDIDLYRSPKSPKKSTKPPILAFKVIHGHWIWRQSTASVRLPISD